MITYWWSFVSERPAMLAANYTRSCTASIRPRRKHFTWFQGVCLEFDSVILGAWFSGASIGNQHGACRWLIWTLVLISFFQPFLVQKVTLQSIFIKKRSHYMGVRKTPNHLSPRVEAPPRSARWKNTKLFEQHKGIECEDRFDKTPCPWNALQVSFASRKMRVI